MPDEDDDFEIELDWEEEPALEEPVISKYKVGDKVVAVGSYLPGGDRRSVAVVQIEKITDWSTISPIGQTGVVYVVKYLWGESLAMPVTKKKKVKGVELVMTVDGMFYVDKKDIHPLLNERSVTSICKRLFPSERKRKKV